MHWHLSNHADKRAVPLADRHYSRKTIGAAQFTPPGRKLVLLTRDADALWVTSFPFAEFVAHAWAGAWLNCLFRNEGEVLSSRLILEAVAATRFHFGEPPSLGMVTMIDTKKVRKKRDFGRCYRRAGFIDARCPLHYPEKVDGCQACLSMTKAGLWVVQMLPEMMPEPSAPMRRGDSLFAELSL